MKIAFYKGLKSENPKTHWTDQLVCAWTKSRYSHCEMVFSDGVCFSSSPRDNGTRFKKINLDSGSWDVFDVSEYLEKFDIEESQIFQDCKNLNGKKYDFFGIFFTFVVTIGKENPKKWFCSEICSKLLLLPIYHNQYSPQTFYEWLKNNNCLSNFNK